MLPDTEFWGELNRLFTVTCQLSSDGTILRASDLMISRCRLRADDKVNFFELFRFKRPTGFKHTAQSARENFGKLFLATNDELNFAIRGQVIDFSAQGLEGLCFVGVPWLWWMQSRDSGHGLTVSDFPVHDVQMDQLLFMSTQQSMVEDLEQVNDELRLAKQEVENQSQLRESFFNHASHEMRTPLGGVISSLTLLSDEHLSRRGRELIEMASMGANRLRDIMTYALESATNELSGSQERVIDFDLSAIIQESIAVMQSKALARRVQLRRTGQHTFRSEYLGKDRMIKQVVINLLSHAIKSSSRGVVTLAVTTEKLSDSYERVWLSVADDGKGISAQEIEHIFELFVKLADNEMSDDFGTGFGLSIVKRYVDELGGKIEVDSASGVGTTFTVSVDLLVSDTVPLSPSTTMHPKLKEYVIKGHVLLIDDMQTNLMLNAKILESLGLTVETAEDGNQAFDKITSDPSKFDLVLMDLNMPGMNGFDTARKLRENPHCIGIPIIALSAYTGDAEKKKALDAGMNGFINKPIVRSELADEFAAWLSVDVKDGFVNTASSEEKKAPVVKSVSVEADGFDPEKVETLFEQVGMKLGEELMDKFLVESARRWEDLRSSIQSAENEAVARQAHTLGSACMTFGLDVAGEAFRKIEREAMADRAVALEDMDAILAPLSSGIEQLEQTVARMRQSG